MPPLSKAAMSVTLPWRHLLATALLAVWGASALAPTPPNPAHAPPPVLEPGLKEALRFDRTLQAPFEKHGLSEEQWATMEVRATPSSPCRRMSSRGRAGGALHHRARMATNPSSRPYPPRHSPLHDSVRPHDTLHHPASRHSPPPRLTTLSTTTPHDTHHPLPPRPMQAMAQSLAAWNHRINVVSRKDIHNLVPRHYLTSLALLNLFAPGGPGGPGAGAGAGTGSGADGCKTLSGARFLDIGTGGGFPGLPLAVACPEAHFTLCDSRTKKLKVVQELVNEFGIKVSRGRGVGWAWV